MNSSRTPGLPHPFLARWLLLVVLLGGAVGAGYSAIGSAMDRQERSARLADLERDVGSLRRETASLPVREAVPAAQNSDLPAPLYRFVSALSSVPPSTEIAGFSIEQIQDPSGPLSVQIQLSGPVNTCLETVQDLELRGAGVLATGLTLKRGSHFGEVEGTMDGVVWP